MLPSSPRALPFLWDKSDRAYNSFHFVTSSFPREQDVLRALVNCFPERPVVMHDWRPHMSTCKSDDQVWLFGRGKSEYCRRCSSLGLFVCFHCSWASLVCSPFYWLIPLRRLCCCRHRRPDLQTRWFQNLIRVKSLRWLNLPVFAWTRQDQWEICQRINPDSFSGAIIMSHTWQEITVV
jgi:hypothetical protein